MFVEQREIFELRIHVKVLSLKYSLFFIRGIIEKWIKDVNEWYPREGTRKEEEVRRWEDDLRTRADATWGRKAHNRSV